jgi:hypothetical protein
MPKSTLEGKPGSLRVTRLDTEGNPTGETVELGAALLGFEFPETEKITPADIIAAHSTIRLTINNIDPDVVALLIGQKLKPRPRWWRFVPRRIRNRIKRRELRRGYGG